AAIALTIAAAAGVLAVSAQAATIVWGGGTGTFATAGNWVGGAAPGASDTVNFDGWTPIARAGHTVTASSTSGGGDQLGYSNVGRLSTRWTRGAFQRPADWSSIV